MPVSSRETLSIDEYRKSARKWFSDTTLPIVPREYEKQSAVLRAWHRELFQAGWIGIHWPKEVGGQGLTVEHQLAFASELTRARAPQPLGSIGLEVVGPTILKFGTDSQRERFIRPLLSGEELWCQGFSEPDAGSDLASLRTKGSIDGDHIVISGQKIWTSWATHADWCAVLVRTDPDAPKHSGISYVLVDMTSPGITVRPIEMLNGDAEFNELFFDDVRVPVENVLGDLGDGWNLAMDTLGWERAGYSIRRRLENEIVFAKLVEALRISESREMLDIGHLYVQLEAFKALSMRTAQRLMRGDVPTPMDSVDKLLLTRTEQHLTGTAMDLLGAYRMSGGGNPDNLDSVDIIKKFLYGRAASVYGGSAQIQRSIIAERLLGLPRGR